MNYAALAKVLNGLGGEGTVDLISILARIHDVGVAAERRRIIAKIRENAPDLLCGDDLWDFIGALECEP